MSDLTLPNQSNLSSNAEYNTFLSGLPAGADLSIAEMVWAEAGGDVSQALADYAAVFSAEQPQAPIATTQGQQSSGICAPNYVKPAKEVPKQTFATGLSRQVLEGAYNSSYNNTMGTMDAIASASLAGSQDAMVASIQQVEHARSVLLDETLAAWLGQAVI